MAFPGVYIDGGTTSSLLNYVIGSRNADNERYRISTSADLERERIASSDKQHAAEIAEKRALTESTLQWQLAAVEADKERTAATERVGMRQLANSLKIAERTADNIEYLSDNAERERAQEKAQKQFLVAGNTMQALIEARDVEIAAELKMPVDKITNEVRKQYSEKKGDYEDFVAAGTNYANTYQALANSTNINNAAASGERILVRSVKDPQVAKMLADSGLEAQGDFIAVRTARGENGSWKPVGLVTNSDGGVAISDNIYDVYDSTVIAGSGVGLVSRLQRKTIAANAMRRAEEISALRANGDITATQAIEQANQTIAALQGDATAIQQQLQEQADRANGQLIIADEDIYKARVAEATNPNLINLATPAGLPAADRGLASRLNTLDRFSSGDAPTAFSYSDPTTVEDREAARRRIEMRDRFGAAFTGREGEVATFVTHNTMDKSPDNNAREQYNERLAGAKTDVDSLDFGKNATGTAARYVKRYVKGGDNDGQFTEEQQKAIRQRILDNYSKWSTELGLPKDISKLGPKEIELLWRKATVEEAGATRGKLARARDFVGGAANTIGNVFSEAVTVPIQAVGDTIATGSLRQGVASAVLSPFRVKNSGDLPPPGTEPGAIIINKYGEAVASPYSGYAHSLNQGNFPRSTRAAANILREEEIRKNYPPTTYR